MFIHNRLGMLEGVETMLAQEQRLNQVANNLANVDTAGYKKESVTFGEMLYNVSHNRQRVGKALSIVTDQQQGNTQLTGNALDLAITGQGFFKIETPGGVRYTRAGNFELDNDGRLRMPNGGLVMGENGPIILDNNEFTIDRQGRVLIDGLMVNRMDIATVDDPNLLAKEGESLFRLKEGGQELAAADFQVKQGFVEKSNVNSVEEMTVMIELQRAYEGQQKMIQAVDEIDNLAVRRVGTLNG